MNPFHQLAVVACLVAVPGTALQAQDTEDPAEPTALTEEQTARLDEQIQTVARQRDDMVRIESYLVAAEGIDADILERRLQEERLEVVDEGVRFAGAVAALADDGVDVDTYRATATDMLEANISIAEEFWDDSGQSTEFPESGQPAAEQAVRNFTFIEVQRDINRVIGLLADSYDLLDRLGAPQPENQTALLERVRERAVNASVYLHMAQDDAAAASAAANAVPDDAEVVARVSVAENLVVQIAGRFSEIVDVLEAFDEDTATYRQQIISASGELTSDAIDVSVIGQLVSNWTQGAIESIGENGPTVLLRAFLFIIIAVAFWKAARVTRGLVQQGMERSQGHMSQLLKRMIVSVSANVVLAVGLLIALSQLGISLGPLLAGLGIAGFIVGFALQDTLANFASGLMILFYRPYDVGDIVEVGGILGHVDQMSLVNTTVNTFDNQRIIIPNSKIWGDTIKNVTAETVRRVDMMFGISYADDIPKTEQILRDIVAGHELVLDDPEPTVRLHELGDSSVNFVVRPWTQTTNYWEVYWDVTRAVKLRFDEAGISIPFPQRDVHIFNEPDSAASNGST